MFESLNYNIFFGGVNIIKSVVLCFLTIFIVIYFFYLFLVILNKKKKNNIFNSNQAKLIINFNKLNVEKINKNKFVHLIGIGNSFIVAVTFTVSELFSNLFIKFLVCFIVLLLLIIVVYKVIGLILKKEGK